LAFVAFDKPNFKDEKDIEPASWTPTSQFVYDQDIGGAIRGTGRADLYWGGGAEAKRMAGVIKNPAKLYYLAPKREI
jgi:membrane-bound lytic murein transglycosylase A